MFTLSIDGFEDDVRRIVREELATLDPVEWFDSAGAADYLGVSRGQLGVDPLSLTP